MPDSKAILSSLSSIANEAFVFALAWHLVVAIALLALLAGVRLRRRSAALLSYAPLVSVSAFAWAYANPFNGLVFTALTAALVWLALRAPNDWLTRSEGWESLLGVALVAFGWVYPHFLGARFPWTTYLFASPMGLLPCPTLSLVIGLTLLGSAPGGRASARILASAGLFYGVWGALRLGVTLDLVLLAGAVGLYSASRRPRLTVGTSGAHSGVRSA
jgi:hypothetical protein